MTTHYQSRTPEYKAWQLMKARCYRPNNNRYYRYGGRGIKVCRRWLRSFENFFADMGFKPSTKHTLDRIDNNANYSPKNCRWATYSEQRLNSSTARKIRYQGRTKNLKLWAQDRGMDMKTLHNRLKLGWTVARALNQPVRGFNV